MSDFNQIAKQLQNGDSTQRLDAIKALYKSNDKRAIKALLWASKNDADAQLRSAASRAAHSLQEKIQRAEAAVTPEPQAKVKASSDEETQRLIDNLLSNEPLLTDVRVSDDDLNRKKKRGTADQPEKVTFWDVGLGLILMLASVGVIFTLLQPWILIGNLTLSNGQTLDYQVTEYKRILYEYYPYDADRVDRVKSNFQGFDVFTVENGINAPYETLFFSVGDGYLDTLADKGFYFPRNHFTSSMDVTVIVPAIIAGITMVVMLIGMLILFARFTGTNGLILFAVSPIAGLLSPLVRLVGAFFFWVIALILIVSNACLLLVFRFVGADIFVREAIDSMELNVQPYAIGNLIGMGYWQTWLLMLVLFTICIVALGMKSKPKEQSTKNKKAK